MRAWGWAEDLWCDMRYCGILWDRGHSVLLASGLHSAIKEPFRITVKSVDCQGSTKIPEWESLRRLETMGTSFPHLHVEDNVPCHATFTAVTLLSPLPLVLPETVCIPVAGCDVPPPWAGGEVGLCCHPMGKCSILMVLAQVSWLGFVQAVKILLKATRGITVIALEDRSFLQWWFL